MFLVLQLIFTVWNDSGYMFDGSSMIFKGVQSLVASHVRKKNECGPPELQRDNIPMSDIVLVHKLDALVS